MPAMVHESGREAYSEVEVVDRNKLSGRCLLGSFLRITERQIPIFVSCGARGLLKERKPDATATRCKQPIILRRGVLSGSRIAGSGAPGGVPCSLVFP
jgi:hypothetical protein